jgi:hypothetical protein
MATKAQRIKAPASILQLHIELRSTKPKVWRWALVLETMTLVKLHLMIHAAFGWGHSHLHEFIAGDGERYGTSAEKSKECSDSDGKSETPYLPIGPIGRKPARSKTLGRLRSKSVPSGGRAQREGE